MIRSSAFISKANVRSDSRDEQLHREQATISSSVKNIDELAECHGSEYSRDCSDLASARASGEILQPSVSVNCRIWERAGRRSLTRSASRSGVRDRLTSKDQSTGLKPCAAWADRARARFPASGCAARSIRDRTGRASGKT